MKDKVRILLAGVGDMGTHILIRCLMGMMRGMSYAEWSPNPECSERID